MFQEEILHQGFEQLEDMGRPSESPYKCTPNKVQGLNTNTPALIREDILST